MTSPANSSVYRAGGADGWERNLERSFLYMALSTLHFYCGNMYLMEALVESHPVFLTDIYLPCPDLLCQGG